MKNKILLFSFLTLLLISCKEIRSLREMQRSTPEVYNIDYNDKELLFIPMHHLGKPEFYDSVKKLVIDKKNNGYTVFYELVKTDFEADSLKRIEIRMKARKLKGFSGTYRDNSDSFEGYIQQPDYSELGIDSSDIWSDVNYLELINKWEELNGEIKLDSIDLNTPFDKPFDKGVDYSNKDYNKVFIRYRNEHLLNKINESNSNKIVILYGFGHLKDFQKLLKENKK